LREIPVSRDPDREVRQRLLASATELFARKGYAAASVREIVTAAGVTPPVLYYYFQSKEGIFLELMRDAWARFDAVLAEALGEEGSAPEKILRLSERILALFREKIDAARVMYAMLYGPPQGAPFFDFDAYHAKFRGAILDLVESGIAEGNLGPGPKSAMMWVIVGAVNIAMEVELCHPELSLGVEGLREVLALVLRGMAPHETKGRVLR
jgi:TetR/AcrR family transcriptional regulator